MDSNSIYDDAVADYYRRLRPLAATYASAGVISRIAVVGNQPLDESGERAAIIDTADVVFRVNGFRVDDEVPTVGTRTDIVVFNRGVRPTPWFFSDYAKRLYLMIEPGRLHWENPKVPEFWPSDLGFVTVANREVIIPLNRHIGLNTDIEGSWATTGTTMLWIAGWLFPDAHIDAAGFSFVDAPHQAAWEHAYGDPSPVGAEHFIDAESRLFREWLTDGRMTLHR